MEKSEKTDVVKMDNGIVQGRWYLPDSILAKRIIALAFVLSNGKDDPVEFNASQLVPGNYKPSSNISKELRSIVSELIHAHIKIESANKVTAINIFSKIEMNSGYTGSFCLTKHILPFVAELKQRYTQFRLDQFIMLKSIYSQRLFELLMSWRHMGQKVIEIGTLYDLLNVPQSIRDRVTTFRTQALERAHKEISEKTHLKYEWDVVRRGAKEITHIRFWFPDEEKRLAEAPVKRGRGRPRTKPELVASRPRQASAKSSRVGDLIQLQLEALHCRAKVGSRCKRDRGEVCEQCDRLPKE